MRALLLPLLLILVMLGGCAFLGRAKEAANTPDPLTGKTPAEVVVTNLPRVIANPVDIPAWLQIVGAITGVVVTAASGYAVKQRANTVAATNALVTLKEQQLEAMSTPPNIQSPSTVTKA